MPLTDLFIVPANLAINLRTSYEAGAANEYLSPLLQPRETSNNAISDLTAITTIAMEVGQPPQSTSGTVFRSAVTPTLVSHDATGFKFSLNTAAVEGLQIAMSTANIAACQYTVSGNDGTSTVVLAVGTLTLTTSP